MYTHTHTPFLDEFLESHWLRAHNLLSLVVAQLYWVVATTKRVVQAGLVRRQVGQQLSRTFILNNYSLPGTTQQME